MNSDDDIKEEDIKEEFQDGDNCPNNTKDPPSNPDPLTKVIINLHYVFIISFAYVIIYTFFKSFIFYICYYIGFTKIISYVHGLTELIQITLYILYIIAIILATLLFVILFWIFIHWLCILIFVPFIIIFPIPIFPFIFILPLQPLMLELIPPFKVLTNVGTLPMMLKISSRIFNQQIITNTFNYFLYPSFKDLNVYFYNNIKQLISDVFYYDIENIYTIPPEKCKTSKQDIINTVKEKENPDDVKKYNEYKETPSVNATMDNINKDTQLCIDMHKKFKEYNANYLTEVSTDMDNSVSPYSMCYSRAIKSYLKSSIVQ